MNSLWDNIFIDPFLSEGELERKYGKPCPTCKRPLMKYPYCKCHLIHGTAAWHRENEEPN